jgi:hypothetical protein
MEPGTSTYRFGLEVRIRLLLIFLYPYCGTCGQLIEKQSRTLDPDPQI